MPNLKIKRWFLLSTTNLFSTSFLTFINTNHHQNEFHITVKSTNKNLVNSIKIWNNDSQFLHDITESKPLDISFDNYQQIINNKWKLILNNEENIIDKQGYKEAQNRIKTNINNFKNSSGFDQGQAYGHTFNSNSSNLILHYQQNIAQTYENGLFAMIYEASKLDLLMQVKYNLLPTEKMLQQELENRAQTFPIGPYENNNDGISSKLFVFYAHQPFSKKTGLFITTKTKSIKVTPHINSNKTFEYAVLNQEYLTQQPATTYKIEWKDENGTILKSQTEKISNTAPNVNIKGETLPSHQYFIKSNNRDIIAFNQIKKQATLTPNIKNDIWTYQRVDDNLNLINPYEEKPIPTTPLKPHEYEDHTIYLLHRKINNVIDNSATQYLNIYNTNPLTLNITDYENLSINQLGNFLQQYLQETTTITTSFNNLNFGQLRFWLLFYHHDLLMHLYNNSTNVTKSETNPWAIKEIQLRTITLINNWSIIIIGSIFLIISIAIPIVILILRRKKITK